MSDDDSEIPIEGLDGVVRNFKAIKPSFPDGKVTIKFRDFSGPQTRSVKMKVLEVKRNEDGQIDGFTARPIEEPPPERDISVPPTIPEIRAALDLARKSRDKDIEWGTGQIIDEMKVIGTCLAGVQVLLDRIDSLEQMLRDMISTDQHPHGTIGGIEAREIGELVGLTWSVEQQSWLNEDGTKHTNRWDS